MAVGDNKSTFGSGSTGAGDDSIDIQPASGETWKILGIYARVQDSGQSITLYSYDGTDAVKTLMAHSGAAVNLVMAGCFAQAGGDGNSGASTYPLKNGWYIDNSNYLRIIFSGGSGQPYRYFINAIQVA